MIDLRNITKTYYMGENSFEALHGINFHVEKGELVTIIGQSGSGKTTTMNIIGLLDRATTGEYYLNGKDASNLTHDEQAEWRNKNIGFVFQYFFLLNRLSAIENVGLPLKYRGMHRKEINERVLEMIDKVGISKYAHHKPNELSGGQRQRVAIARALAGSPSIILADEPTGALDSKTSQEVLDLLIGFNKNDGATVVIITHDPEVARQGGRVIRIQDGSIVK